MSLYKEKKYPKHFLTSLIPIIFFMGFTGLILHTKVQENIYIKKMKRETKKHINILHEYYDKNGSIPTDYDTGNESIVYMKENDSNFIFYFILGFDETIIYHSTTRCWNIE